MKLAIKHTPSHCPTCTSDKKHSFIQRQVKASRSRPNVQPKLKVGHPNDKYEREADAMAEQVMRMPMESSGTIREKHEQEGVQLKCAACEQQVQTKLQDDATESNSASLSGQLNTSKGRGSSLRTSHNRPMSRSFGHDFSRVRIHTGAVAHTMNSELNARAFTHGSDIYFNEGEYAPHTSKGKELLVHELTHTVQEEPSIIRRKKSKDASCSKYVNGEIGVSKKPRGLLSNDVFFHSSGKLVIADFGIGWGSVKESAKSSQLLKEWLNRLENNSSYTNIEIVGYSDCHGDYSLNSYLRGRRAQKVKSLLGPNALSKVTYIRGAPHAEYLESNYTPKNRARNRAVTIKFDTNVVFDKSSVISVSNPHTACFDGNQIKVQQGNRMHTCDAASSKTPAPDGLYCIREQGQAQRPERWYRSSHKSWYLLEPQFKTSRSRMHLHPGSTSKGCIIVKDKKCFKRLQILLTGGLG